MGMQDQERLHELCKKADEFSFYVIAGDMRYLDEYLSALRAIYRILKSIKGGEALKDYDKDLSEIINLRTHIKRRKVIDSRAINNLVNRLDKFHERLYRFKQLLGMGVPVYRVRSQKRMMEEALGAVNPK